MAGSSLGEKCYLCKIELLKGNGQVIRSNEGGTEGNCSFRFDVCMVVQRELKKLLEL